MSRLIVKNTTQLEPGDVVLNHGMRLLVEEAPSSCHDGRAVATDARLLNLDEVKRQAFVPMSWLEREDGVPRWRVQGNDLAQWYVEAPDASYVPGQVIDLSNARSYFSDGFEARVADPDELKRQLVAHAMESDTVRAAIVELAAFSTFLAQAGRITKAAKTLAGRTILELIWNAGGELDYGKVMVELRRRVKGGVRRERVFTQLENAGVITIDYATFRRGGDKAPMPVRLGLTVELELPSDEELVEELAKDNPRHALEGWAAGLRSYGDDAQAELVDAAIRLQDEAVTVKVEVEPELERLQAKVEELERIDREDEAAYRAAVRTGDAPLAGRMASRWSVTRGELVTTQLELRRATVNAHPVFESFSPEARDTIARNA